MNQRSPLHTRPLLIEWSAARGRHLFFLALATLVVAMALLLDVRGDRVVVAGLPGYPLPHLCMSRSLFGMSCPGCGLTRSFIYLAHGDWQAAWRVHRLGWLVAAIVLFQLPYRAWMLAGRRDGMPVRLVQWYAGIVVALLLVNWCLGLVEASSFRLPGADEIGSVFYRGDDDKTETE